MVTFIPVKVVYVSVKVDKIDFKISHLGSEIELGWIEKLGIKVTEMELLGILKRNL